MKKEHTLQIRVYWEDTDAGGVVYYANYLKYLERARTETLRTAGLDQSALIREQNLVFAVISADLKYHKPARLDDHLTINTQITNATRTSVSFEQNIYRDPGDTSCQQELLYSASIRVACLFADSFKPRAIPEHIKKEFV